MKRPLRRFEVICLAAALGGGGACTPNNSVKPGAPVLIQVSIVEGGGTTVTNIPPGEPACAADAVAGNPCATDAGTTMCELPTSVWCQCGADGTWACNPFSTTSNVMFVFDRLLNGEPLVAADGGTTMAGATLTAATPISYTTDYASNGSPGELIFGSPFVLNDVRSVGPNIFVTPNPALPAGSVVTATLDPATVMAKDGHTPFTDNGQFGGGTVTFATALFSASIVPPSPPMQAPDAAAITTVALDATGAIVFTSPVDTTALMANVTVTAGGTPVPFTLSSMDNLTVTITPMDMWPANSTITITVTGAATDLNGETLGTPVTQEFMTGAN
jgi:hypothetical protein